MRILVTGATGFLGGALVRRALAGGHEVCALVRPGQSLDRAAGLTVCRGTLADPPWPELARFAAEACVHTAWITTPGVYPESSDNDRYRDESRRLLSSLFERGVRHVVALGTSAEYRPAAAPLDEARSPLEPQTRYARAKHELHVALAEQAVVADARLAWARVFQPYGVGEPVDRLCSAVIRRLGAGQRVTPYTPQAIRDWIHVDDVAEGLLRLLESRASGPVNVGCGVGRTVGSVASMIAELMGRPDLVTTRPADPEPTGLVADPTRLRSLGWRPSVELEEGLRELIDHLV
jgi:nucleoside-diphosphate-sugar epimerase